MKGIVLDMLVKKPGPAIQTGGWRYYAKGMTGFGTRMLARLASRL